jgi:two-component system NtrC family sensor kinase
MWQALCHRYHSALRYQLLALVLAPLLLAMALALGYTLYWLNDYTRETLYLTVRDDLALARHALRQYQDETQAALQQLAESAELRSRLQAGDAAGVERLLRRARDARGFAFLHLTGVAGNWLDEPGSADGHSSKPSPVTDRAARGIGGAAFELFGPEDLKRENAGLAREAQLSPTAAPRALMLRLAQPITDERGHVLMTLDAAVLLNHNRAVLDAIRDRVFGAGTLPDGADPIVTLALDNLRIAAATSGLSGLEGERVARTADGGDLWVGRDQLGGDDFISAYGPLFDVNGQRIGLLHVGFRESAFRAPHYRAAALLLVLFLAITALAAWLAVRGVRTIVGPIERMTAVVRATQAGEERRIGPLGARDEIGELARQFDAMLDLLQQRNREIEQAAHVLEAKVVVRTQELAQKNVELQATVSLLQETREQLVLAEKLAALGQMAAGIAHEINNPAAVILGNLEVLAAELGDAARPVAPEIELISQQVERIRHIVKSLLQFARSAPAEGPIVDVDVNRAAEDLLPLVAYAIKRKSIALTTRLEATSTVAINVFDLEQVLINLVMNAANAVVEGGAIDLVTADWEQRGVVISVRDNGAGIPPERLTRIFDPFFTTDPGHGAGLGLSVSYGLVRRYGGHISVESVVGQGSVFRVWLLRHPQPLEDAASAAA